MIHSTKTSDLKFQHLQNLIVKCCLTIVSHMGNELFNIRLESEQEKVKVIYKNLIKRCVDSDYSGNQNLSILGREQIMPELNQHYWKLLFSQEGHPK